MVNGKIYGLYDSVGNLRYIGQTVQTLKDRLRKHIIDCYKRDSHVARWLKSQISLELQPSIKLLTICDNKDELDRLEIIWIACGRASGANLTNIANGGNTSLGIKRSRETKEKLRARKLGTKHSEETKHKQSLAHRGLKMPPRPPEMRLNYAVNKGRIFSASWRANLAEAQQGRKHPLEVKQKMSIARKKYWEKQKEKNGIV